MQKKWIFLAGILLLLLAAGWAYYVYQKPRAGVASVSAAYRITAEKLYNEFTQNEDAANKKYIGKVLEVTGVVSEVQVANSAIMVLLGAGEMGGVNCSFLKTFKNPMPQKGENITVKGRCTGFLMDVALVDAVLIK